MLLEDNSSGDVQVVCDGTFLFDLLRDFNDKFDGVLPLLVGFFLKDVADLLIDFDQFGQKLFLVAIALIEEKDLLDLNLSIFGANQRDGFEGA